MGGGQRVDNAFERLAYEEEKASLKYLELIKKIFRTTAFVWKLFHKQTG